MFVTVSFTAVFLRMLLSLTQEISKTPLPKYGTSYSKIPASTGYQLGTLMEVPLSFQRTQNLSGTSEAQGTFAESSWKDMAQESYT